MLGSHVRVQLDRKVPMRDGVLLSTDLYLPPEPGPYPALLCRTIYDNQVRFVEWAQRFVDAGYAVVLQDCRGRYDSDGEWEPYLCEAADGYDTQQWLGQQPWCDGNVGTFGLSYLGFTQVQTAPRRSPYLKALVPMGNQEDNFGHLYSEGVLQLQNAINFAWIGYRTVQWYARHNINVHPLYWKLPLVSAMDDYSQRPIYKLFLSHPTFDDYWRSYSLKNQYAEIEAPALFITGWYDNLVHEMFKCYAGWSQQARSPEARRRSKLLVGPWVHNYMGSAESYGDVQFGPNAALDLPGVHLRWYDQRLKGIANGIDEEPPVRIFVMGENVWRDESEWPLARTQYTNFYLHSGGRANSFVGDGALGLTAPADEPPDTFDYDPEHPVPTVGGQSQMPEYMGPRDRRAVERRDDVLVYSTPPLERAVEVTGPVEVVLFASTSAVDTDFTAALVDVHPNGQCITLTQGIVRARYRESLERATFVTPGQVYQYTITLWETSNLFRAGHRVRLEVSSSNFPHFDRNLNSGEDLATGCHPQVAHQTILHSAEYPSHLRLPVIPR
jgi:putative CocE/NonD family hydrolase